MEKITHMILQRVSRLKGKLNGDEHARELLLGSIAALGVKVLAAVSAFAMNLVLARVLGASEAGLFFLAFTLVTILAAVARMGLDNSVVRFISAEHSQGHSSQVHAVYRKAMLWTLGLSCPMLAALLALNPQITNHLFTQAGFAQVLWAMTFALPLIALYTLHAQALQGLKKVAKAMSTLNVSVPLLVLLGVLLLPVDSAVDTAWMFVGACALTIALGWIWWRSSAPAAKPHSAFDSRVLLASCLPLWGVMLFSQAIQWSSQLLLGVWGSPADVALFASAQRTAMLTSFILIAVNGIAAPKFAAMHRQGDMEGLRRMALLSGRLMLLAAVPALLFMLVFPEWLMGLFGEEFRQGAASLRILAMGQFVNIATGSVGFLLMMTGNERRLRLNVFIGAMLGVVLGLWLVPSHGLTGAAIATAVAVASQNLLGVYQVKRTLGFNTLAFWKTL